MCTSVFACHAAVIPAWSVAVSCSRGWHRLPPGQSQLQHLQSPRCPLAQDALARHDQAPVRTHTHTHTHTHTQIHTHTHTHTYIFLIPNLTGLCVCVCACVCVTHFAPENAPYTVNCMPALKYRTPMHACVCVCVCLTDPVRSAASLTLCCASVSCICMVT